MSERLLPTLQLLDDGLAIYRRSFAAFVLIAAVWFVPVAVGVGLLVAFGSRLQGEWILLLFALVALLSLPLLIYLIAMLSRAANAAVDGRPVRLREALAVPPLRLVSMGCFTMVYGLVAYIVSSMLSLLCICPLYVFGIAGMVGAVAFDVDSEAVTSVFVVLFFLVMLLLYGFSVMLSSATYTSMVYALQPWIATERPFGEALQQSLDLLGYRLGRTSLTWCAAGLLFSAVSVTVSLAVGVLVPLPVLFVLGSESQIAQAVAASAWMLGLVVVLPPLPIWMVLLYRRSLADRSGADLDARIQAWGAAPKDLPL